MTLTVQRRGTIKLAPRWTRKELLRGDPPAYDWQSTR